MKSGRAPKILIIRRENIGDLVCTTPLISMLRNGFDKPYIACLVNVYNAQVLEGNTDIDDVFFYKQNRHQEGKSDFIRGILKGLLIYLKLLFKNFDYVVVATTHYPSKTMRLVKSIFPRKIIAFVGDNDPCAKYVDIPVKYRRENKHIVEELVSLAFPLVGDVSISNMKLFPEKDALSKADSLFKSKKMICPIIGIHISSRRESQRWSVESFKKLIRELYDLYGYSFVLFWSPGNESNRLHPGDDNKAKAILSEMDDLPLIGYETTELRDLIAGISLCNSFICSDGGAMHIAAALGKPTVALFGVADASRWYPWGVPHVVLQTGSREACDVSVQMVVNAYSSIVPKPQMKGEL
ncbi:MAG: glycosyltransferase family 9 protein [Thiothrix sp.]|uniref:glycosyltransferase family 9 protein n=1 Tax=Thiothrix sp. TaxID=1032 RepID=UPI002618C4C1|nr:glycosyltransferase family 9 protein [Thiothrix sp.]MDD5394638.1 glycosyltransferase family 9 protein [Thiothrix sp.]